MPKKKAVLIGAGSIGGFKNEILDNVNTGVITHGHAIWKHCNPVAVVDPDAEKRNYVKNKWRFRDAWGSFELIPDKGSVDLWVIASPPETHLDVIRQLSPYLNKKKVVLLEKPAGTCRVDAEDIQNLSSTYGFKVFINYQRCYLPDYDAKKIQQHIGSIEDITLHYCRGFVRDASHFFALLSQWWPMYFIGEVSSTHDGYTDFSMRDLTIDAMAPRLHIVAHDGKIADVFQIEIVGKTGRVVFEDHGKIMAVYPHKKETTFGTYWAWGNVPELTVNTGLDNGLDAVYSSILANKPKGFTIADALKTWEIIHKFLEAT